MSIQSVFIVSSGSGYYAIVAPALEKRIKVSVCSCYAFVQELRYRESEASVPSDFHFMDRFTLCKFTGNLLLLVIH